jgi:hypothetical protein
MSVAINFKQAKELVELFGGEDAEITLTEMDDGLRAHFTDYPEEGTILLEE